MIISDRPYRPHAQKIWDAKVEGDSVTFSLTSPDGEEDYPGTVNTSVKYELTPDKRLSLTYTSTSDKPTPINMTNHTYFNLSGAVCCQAAAVVGGYGGVFTSRARSRSVTTRAPAASVGRRWS